MTTPFDKPLNGYRFAETQFGDTLQAVAARELGDASQWPLLISLNNLVYPFLTDDPDAVVPGVILNGSYIVIPAASPSADEPDPNSVFGTDVLLAGDGFLATENGDFALVSGAPNLKQALENAIETDQGELKFHLGYGTLIRRILGSVNGPTAALLAAEYAKQTVQADPRISTVPGATGQAAGDIVQVAVSAKTIAATNVDVTRNIQG